MSIVQLNQAVHSKKCHKVNQKCASMLVIITENKIQKNICLLLILNASQGCEFFLFITKKDGRSVTRFDVIS